MCPQCVYIILKFIYHIVRHFGPTEAHVLCANIGWLIESSNVMVRLASPTMQVLVCKTQSKYKTVEADIKLMMIHY